MTDRFHLIFLAFTRFENRGTYATGTVVVKRKDLPQSFKTTRLLKGAKSQQDLLAILYADRKHVTFLTSDNGR